MRATSTDDHVTIAIEGHLDSGAGEKLVDAVVRALADEPTRIDIDLSVLSSFTSDGALALARCRDLCSQVPDGLHYRTEGGAGQLAVLSAFERETEVDTQG
jgi:hypothetical protein